MKANPAFESNIQEYLNLDLHGFFVCFQICDLSSKTYEKDMWEVEVRELQNLLRGQIKIQI